MFIIVEPHNYAAHADLIDQSFTLRKRVFADQLQWDVPVHDGRERDAYDGLNPAYLMWCDEVRTTLYGVARLMPTTAPTLLHDVFGRTVPDDLDLRAPGIWECTRLAIDEAAIERDMPQTGARQGFRLMLVALCEVAVRHGLDSIVCNYEPVVARLYRGAGAVVDEIGRADGYGRRPMCCGLIETSRSSLARMRDQVGVDGELLAPRRRVSSERQSVRVAPAAFPPAFMDDRVPAAGARLAA